MGLRRSLKSTNILTNGNFAGITGWSIANATGSASNNEATFTATAQYGFLGQQHTGVAGNKYYIRALVKADSNQVKLLANTLGVSGVLHDGSNTYKYLSAIGTGTGSASNFAVQDTRLSNWSPVSVKECIAINLFNLPPDVLILSDTNLKEWCDNNFPHWFDGTINSGKFGGL